MKTRVYARFTYVCICVRSCLYSECVPREHATWRDIGRSVDLSKYLDFHPGTVPVLWLSNTRLYTRNRMSQCLALLVEQTICRKHDKNAFKTSSYHW